MPAVCSGDQPSVTRTAAYADTVQPWYRQHLSSASTPTSNLLSSFLHCSHPCLTSPHLHPSYSPSTSPSPSHHLTLTLTLTSPSPSPHLHLTSHHPPLTSPSPHITFTSPHITLTSPSPHPHPHHTLGSTSAAHSPHRLLWQANQSKETFTGTRRWPTSSRLALASADNP